jgi:hypothetical protein
MRIEQKKRVLCDHSAFDIPLPPSKGEFLCSPHEKTLRYTPMRPSGIREVAVLAGEGQEHFFWLLRPFPAFRHTLANLLRRLPRRFCHLLHILLCYLLQFR